MKTIKIIDLLNKIANSEEVPKKFKYGDYIFEFSNNTFIDNDGDYLKESICGDLSNLNDEVEIIEEETKPITKESIEALGYACGEIQKCFTNGWNKSLENKPLEDKKIEKLSKDGTHWISEVPVIDKINEIIDKINMIENDR